MSSSLRPHRRQPTRLPRPWDSPGKNTGVGCHFLLQCTKVKSESEVLLLGACNKASHQKSSRPCYKCGKEGHWACSCPKPRPPLGPSPNYGIKGHWKVDCPHLPLGTRHCLPVQRRSPWTQLCLALDSPLKTKGAQGPRPQLSSPLQSPGQLTVAGKPISFLINTGPLLCHACLFWKN